MTSSLDERTPVLVGVGQCTDRTPDVRECKSPLQLLQAAAELAARDAGLERQRLAELDQVVVVKSFRNEPRNPPEALARALGASRARRLLTSTGGHTPQWLVNRTAEQIARGELRLALLCGAEAIDTAQRAERQDVTLAWDDPSLTAPELLGEERRGTTKHEHRHGLSTPAYSYPLFENALRARHGWSLLQHREQLGRLFSRFSAVAARHPGAWFPHALAADEISEPGPDNRMIAFPYTKRMNAMNAVNQSAAVLLTSVAAARALGIDPARFVYLHGCADASDHFYLLERVDYTSSPAIARAGREALAMAEVGIDAIRWFDLYACFPSAVQIARDMLGIGRDDPRELTVTGGLPYHGGPGNNTTMHAIATMVERVRTDRAALGLVTGNGYYLTLHSIGIYGASPDPNTRAGRPWQRVPPERYQSELDALPRPAVEEAPSGPARVETYTVVYDREGRPAQGIVIGRLEHGARFVAHTPTDRNLLEAMVGSEAIAMPGHARPGQPLNLFVPS